MEMSDEWNPNPQPGDSPNDEIEISLLEAFDRALAALPPGDFTRERLGTLRLALFSRSLSSIG